jgi:predicted RNA-binding Zn-ribbon protein involved in translation (DUF1610 family)/sugar lactone lactonase YvrE
MANDASVRAFKCPSCGAPLEPETGTLTMKCPYCGGTVIIPESLRTAPPRSGPSMGEVFDFGLNGVDLNQIVGNAMHLPQAIELARQGRTDEAATIYSQITGMEHADAVESVKAMAAGHAVSLTPGRSGATWQTVETSYSRPSVQVTTRPPVTFSSSSFSTAPAATAKRASGGRSCGLLLGIVAAVAALIFVLAGGGAFLFARGLPLGPIGFASRSLSFGSEGIGPGQFEDARSLGVDANGNITVADYQDGRIQTFDSSGKFLSGFSVSPNGRKVYVTSMTVDRNGDVYVVHDGKIFVYDATGNQVEALGDLDHRYEDVTIGGDGKIYAIENNETIVRFNADRSIALEVPDTFTDATGNMELDSHVAADGLGNMYVVGSFHYLVLKFSPDGKFLNRFGGEAQSATGDEPGKFSTPRAIVVDGYGRVYVSDFFDVKVFDSSGAYLNKIDINGGPFGLAVDGQNFLYVMTSNKNVVKYAVQKPAE